MSAPTPVTLIGFRHSVYQRIVRIVLHEKEAPYVVEEIDPFDAEQADRLRNLHPFGRVPALRHGGFHLYETAAITRYVDLAFNGPNLVPGDPLAAARMAQVIAIWDAYGYHPMVRQVFARRYRERGHHPNRQDDHARRLPQRSNDRLLRQNTRGSDAFGVASTPTCLVADHARESLDYHTRSLTDHELESIC